jgi:hypothetical protein
MDKNIEKTIILRINIKKLVEVKIGIDDPDL